MSDLENTLATQMSIVGIPTPVRGSELRNCLVCGKEYRAYKCYLKRGGGLHCSHKCAGIARGKKHIKQYRICVVCGRSFHLPQCRINRGAGTGTYCSLICKIKGQAPEIKYCLVCHNVVRRSLNRYCSKKCNGAAHKGKSNGNWNGGDKSAKCETCGKTYLYKRASKGRFCSLKCYGYKQGKVNGDRTYSYAKGGNRKDLHRYFRSAWEANWARYLNWLISIGEIKQWDYEPDTFEFVSIKRGSRFYTPDFRVINKDGSIEYHEIKGWLDPRSATKLKRMAKYYPAIKLILIQKKQYSAVSRQVRRFLPNWEYNKKHAM